MTRQSESGANRPPGSRSPPEAPRRRTDAEVDPVARSDRNATGTQDRRQGVHEFDGHQPELNIQNKEINTALAASRQHYLDLYENAPVGYLTLGVDGVIAEPNRMAASMLLVDARSLEGRKLWEFVPIEQQPALTEKYLQFMAGKQLSVMELQLLRADGSTFWAQLHMVPDFDPAGARRCHGAMIDITRHMEVQQRATALAAIVEFSDDAIISRDLDGKIVSWNAGATRLLGHAGEEMVGQNLDSLLPVEKKGEPRWIRRLRKGEGLAHFEADLLARDGHSISVSLSLSPIRDGAGRVSGTSMIARDISERVSGQKAQERRLRQLHLLSDIGQTLLLKSTGALDMLAQVFERVCHAVGANMYFYYRSLNGRQKLELVSSTGLNAKQRTQAASLRSGESLCWKVGQDRAPVVMEGLQDSDLPEAAPLRAAGVKCYAGFPLLAGDELIGVAAFAMTSAERFQDGDLQVIRTVCDQVSVTLERTKLFQDLHASEQELKTADRKKDDFIATLAHELRNPLAPIHNAVHILRRIGKTTPSEQEVFDTMERQVAYMVRLVDDLLDISRVTRGKIVLRNEPLQLAEIMRSASELSKPVIEACGHRLDMRAAPEPIALEGDAVRLAQVFANLLNNAAKYTERGGVITFESRRDGEHAEVRVADTGIGISPELLPHVFEMFTQGNPTGSSQGGLGIGLTLARTLVDMHGGSIEASSPGLGKGSVFRVRLPLPTLPDVTSSRSVHALPPLQGSCRVLLADDNRDAADSLAYLLRLSGAEVRVAYDGMSALNALDSFTPTFAILDIGMPGMDGYEVARHIREHPTARNLTLIALTGWGQAEDRQRTRRAGFDFHLVKPADLGDLHRILQTHGD